MEKIKYAQIENYDMKKQNIINAFQKTIGKIPQGLQFDIAISSLIKIYEYFDKKYKGIKIPAKDIPDVKEFAVQHESYTIGQLIINRIAKNVKEIDFQSGYDEKNKTMACYLPNLKKITVYNTNLDGNIEKAFKHIKNVEFESVDDFRHTMTEQTLIHEFLHAISDTGLSWGLQSKNSKQGLTLNEGITENISLEIAGLKNVFNKGVWTDSASGTRFGLRGQTSGGYILENNIANFVRLASKEDLDFHYIIDGRNVGFGVWDKIQIYGTSNPLELIIDTMDQYVLAEWNEQTFAKVQELQTMLIEDILENKYNSKFFKQTSMTQAQYDDLVEDVMLIGNCLIPTLPSQEKASQIAKKEIQEKGYVEKIDFSGTSAIISQQIQEGKLENTKNVQKYMQLLDQVDQIGQKFGLERTSKQK